MITGKKIADFWELANTRRNCFCMQVQLEGALEKRPVARIFRRRVTYTAKLEGSWGMLPQEILKNLMLTQCVVCSLIPSPVQAYGAESD